MCTACAMPKLRACRAQRVQVAHIVPRSWLQLPVLVATPRPGRNLIPLPSPRPGRNFIPKSQPLGQPSQVATSIPCRDLPSSPTKTNQVVTSKLGRDLHFPQARSRPQNGVTTPMASDPCTPKLQVAKLEVCHYLNQVAMSTFGRNLKPNQTRS